MNFVLCTCGKHYHASAALERIKQDSGCYSVGARCPHCRLFTHSYFETEDTVKQRDELAELGRHKHSSKRQRRLYAMALDNYERSFAALQESLREVIDGG